ncbi:MAG: phytanoyl-CoA dioxygenase family protein [Pseudomonadota bacterium]|nr:phytanoyl-CoA dioxygenase family protein [Pseudomonadota bacterium]
MNTTEALRSSPPILTEEEVENYKQQGYVVPKWKYPAKSIEMMQRLVQELIEANPDHYQEQLVCPHLPQGATKPMVSERHQDFLNLAMEEGVRKILGQILGPDVLLWGSQLFCKPAAVGMEIPWHQDGAYWPIRPLANISAWIAIDRVSRENACLKVIPGSHLSGLKPHQIDSRKNLALDRTVNPEHLNKEEAVDIELDPGELVFFDVYLMHGSNANTSGERRAGLVYRYMPSTSLFDRSVQDKINKSGHLVSYKDRPLFQVLGDDPGRNTKIGKVS